MMARQGASQCKGDEVVSEKFMKILKEVGKSTKEAALETLRDIISDAGVELKRAGDQGRSEVASALFNGNGFVLYGPGQDISKYQEPTPNVTQVHEAPEVKVEEQSQGIEM
jgi:hypothetical protein